MWECRNAQNHVRDNQYKKMHFKNNLMKQGQYDWWRIWKSKQGGNVFKGQTIQYLWLLYIIFKGSVTDLRGVFTTPAQRLCRQTCQMHGSAPGKHLFVIHWFGYMMEIAISILH